MMKMAKCHVVLLIVLSTHQVSARNFYCPSGKSGETFIIGDTYGTILTLKEGQSHYSNNETCHIVYTASANSHVHLKIEYSDLQWSSHQSACDGYDHVEVKDGIGTLTTWCGKNYPREINSRDGNVEITFKTDESNPRATYHRGVKIFFRAFLNTTCPPGWFFVNDSCYTTTSVKQKWDEAQQDCNMRQGNLLKIESKAELDYLTKKILNASEELFYWTGLNDIAEHKKLKWTDNSPFKTFKSFDKPPTPMNKDKHCGAIHTGQRQIFMESCNNVVLNALCKANRTSTTVLYSIPRITRDKGVDDSLGSVLFGIAIASGIIAVILIIVMVLKRRGIILSPRHYFPKQVNEEEVDREQQVPLSEGQFKRVEYSV